MDQYSEVFFQHCEFKIWSDFIRFVIYVSYKQRKNMYLDAGQCVLVSVPKVFFLKKNDNKNIPYVCTE